jgi:hypothetical protein
MRRTRKTAVFLALLGLALMAAVPVGADQPARPFKMHTTGYATFIPGVVDPITGDSCPHFGGLGTFGFASGEASHLGRVEMQTAHCTPLGTEAITGRMLLVAANGDELVLQYEGGANPDIGPNHVTATYEVTFVGSESTGRFEDAEGDGLLTVHLTFEDFNDPVWPGEFWVEGSIDY